MPKRKTIYARKKEASAQVSTQTRTLAFGFLAIAWALLTAHDEPLHSMAANVDRYWILMLAITAVIVLALDMLQYVAVTRMAESTYRKAEAAGQKDNVLYDQTSCAYKAQAFFYHAKFWVLGLGSLVLVVIFILLFTASPQHPPPANPAYSLPPALLDKAVVLTRIRTLLAFGSTAWMILVLLVVLRMRWPAALRNWAERITPSKWCQGLLFLPPAIIFISLIPLPLAIYSQHIERAYGLSVQSWPSWSLDQLKALGLSILVYTPVLMLLFRIIRKSPRRWWLWFWACTLPIIVFTVFISPIWIDPVFNHFSPLEKSDPALTLQLEQLAHHVDLDIPPSRMFLMRASEKVTGLNAYVTGIGASKRIVVWDNTIQKLPPNQILFVVGHEMGHYVLDHIYKGIAFTMAVLIVLLWLAYFAVNALVRRFGNRWQIRAPDDWAALAVLLLVFTCITFLFSPIANAFSRWEEHEADIFGQEAIHGLVPDPQITAQKAFVALGENYLEAPNPNPFVEFWLYSHPSISQRVNFAAHYDPWQPGHHARYFPR